MPRHTALSISAAALDVGALAFVALSAHAVACSRVGAPASGACGGPLVMPLFTPAAAAGLAVAVLLGLIPWLTLRTGRRWPCVLSAIGQTILQVAGLGLFLPWLPVLALTVAAAATGS